MEAELEEVNKRVRALKEDADNLKDTETVEAQHVQVGRLRLLCFFLQCDNWLLAGTYTESCVLRVEVVFEPVW